MTLLAPGSVGAALERQGSFARLAETLPKDTVLFADARVLRLHPAIRQVVGRFRHLSVRAGEAAKSLTTLERWARTLTDVPRSATFVALGGGTVGDVVTVMAHLHKRGVRLVQVPSTLLAAVDSSIGGKGAVNIAGVKNALGVFHAASETWICPELFETLSERQRCEGRLEAWKMVVTLDGALARRFIDTRPTDAVLLAAARKLKSSIVQKDPYETLGLRVVLNFGHTFGHVLETISDFRVSHGEAVGLGMLCALDVGRRLGVTQGKAADAVEHALPNSPTARLDLARLIRRTPVSVARKILAGDKKRAGGQLKMVLLTSLGRWTLADVSEDTWAPLWKGRWSGRE